ncbi:MAG: ABC transporter substrate-binding protein [Stellaceae bacterium]|jgi:phospholipid transport system substrate-binding protein
MFSPILQPIRSRLRRARRHPNPATTRLSALTGAAVLIAVATLAPTPSAAADPAGFIAALGTRLQSVVRDVPAEQRPAEFRQLFTEDFDVPLIARFVFGRYWRAAAPAQRQELTETFQDYLIARYSDRLSAYADSGRTPVVTGCRPVDGGVLVNSEVVLGRSPTQGGRGVALPPLTVGWRLVEEDGGYKIADVVVDGVSMAITQRAEFADEIQREGGQLPALVAILREQTGGTGR